MIYLSYDIPGRHWTCWEAWRTRRPRFKGELWVQIFKKGKFVMNVSEMRKLKLSEEFDKEIFSHTF